MSEEIPNEFRPRKCHVVKWLDFQGYGFNLHAEKGKAGQFIGKVDADSPAEKAGLKEGDRIVEVNGVNIGNENHQQVVTRIKSGGEETTLLVVDTESDDWFKQQKLVIRGDLPGVLSQSALREEDVDEESTAPPPEYDDVEAPPPVEPEPIPEPVSEPVVEAAPPVNGDSDEDSLHRPRQCHLRIWPTFQGYGFNLHAERDKPGQYIGLVDDDSPASTAGLRVHDRIVEVNGANVEGESHTDVIGRIKSVPGEARLLVVDRDTDAYYQNKGVTVSSSMPQVEFNSSPHSAPDVPETEQVVEASQEPEAEPTPVVEEEEKKEEEAVVAAAPPAEEEKEEEKKEEEEVESKKEEEEPVVEPPPAEAEAIFVPPPPPPVEDEPEPEEPVNGLKSSAPEPPSEPEYTLATQQQAVEPPKPAAPATTTPATNNNNNAADDGLEFNLSVSEMKERLKAKKRQDPRLNKVPFEQKYKAFQRM